MYGVIDFASIFPFYLEVASGASMNLGFLKACRTLRALKFLKILENTEGEGSRTFWGLVHIQKHTITIIRCISTMVIVMFVAAGMFVSLDPEAVEEDFWISLYFILITITTVGYGDYSPTNTLGKIAICFAILACLITFPAQYGKIAEALDEREKEENKHHVEELEKLKHDRERSRGSSLWHDYDHHSLHGHWDSDHEGDHGGVEMEQLKGSHMDISAKEIVVDIINNRFTINS